MLVLWCSGATAPTLASAAVALAFPVARLISWAGDTMTDKPNIPQPLSATAKTALTLLAQWFEDHSAIRRKFADGFRDAEPEDFAEQDAIAKTFANAAQVAWDLVGNPERRSYRHTIAVDTRGLAALIERADMPGNTPSAPGMLFWSTDAIMAMNLDELEPFCEAFRAGEEVATPDAGWLESGVRSVLLHVASVVGAAKTSACVVGLENRPPANEVQSAERQQYEKTIEQQKARIAELDKLLCEAKRFVDDAHKEHASLASEINDMRRARDEALPCSIVVDGKTPGDVDFAARCAAWAKRGVLGVEHRDDRSEGAREADEAGAQAVLRAFGPELQRQAVREALERVRAQLNDAARSFGAEHLGILRPDWMKAIDAELVRCGCVTAPLPPKDPRVDWTMTPRGAVLGGECARCLHRAPLHEPGCVLLECTMPSPCACFNCYHGPRIATPPFGCKPV